MTVDEHVQLAAPPHAPGAGELFQLLRDGRGRTRAELAQTTSLARSTIAARVDSLIRAGLVAPMLTSMAGQPAASESSRVIRPKPTPKAAISQVDVRPVDKAFVANPEVCPPPPPSVAQQPLVACDAARETRYELGPVALPLGITDARAQPMPGTPFFAVQVDIDESSSKQLHGYISGHVGAEIAFVRNSVVILSTAFSEANPQPSFRLSGDFTREAADALARDLRGG